MRKRRKNSKARPQKKLAISVKKPLIFAVLKLPIVTADTVKE